MSSYCDNITCPSGNCVGCKDGNQWCKDPRCHPYCPNCTMPERHDTWVFLLIILIIIVLLVIIYMLYMHHGPPMIAIDVT